LPAPLDDPNAYYESVTLHGTAMAYVVTTFFAMGFGYAVTATSLGRPLRGVAAAEPDALLGDKAFDSDSFISTLNEREITPVIPPKINRKIKRDCDFALYRERNLVERFFNKIKHFRAIATRYDKLAKNFLAAVRLVSAIILLN
jgi:putative transposase